VRERGCGSTAKSPLNTTHALHLPQHGLCVRRAALVQDEGGVGSHCRAQRSAGAEGWRSSRTGVDWEKEAVTALLS
jgi:hypothetical protein